MLVASNFNMQSRISFNQRSCAQLRGVRTLYVRHNQDGDLVMKYFEEVTGSDAIEEVSVFYLIRHWLIYWQM